MVFDVPNDVRDRFTSDLRGFVSDRGHLSARARVTELARDGLAIYAYYYPTLPIRASHAIGTFPFAFGVNVPAQASMHTFDLSVALEGWVSLLSEMLVAGYLPTTPVHTGFCLQIQNLVVDGGFCDIDSVEKITNLPDERAIMEALTYSLRELAVSFVQLVAQGMATPCCRSTLAFGKSFASACARRPSGWSRDCLRSYRRAVSSSLPT